MSARTSSSNSEKNFAPLGTKMSQIASWGTVMAVYSPLVAITEISGNRLRTTDSNSNPDMCGRFNSVMSRSGLAPRKMFSASKPFRAVITS